MRSEERCLFRGTLIVVSDASRLGVPRVRPDASNDDRAFHQMDDGGCGVTGLKALELRDLTYRMAFLACSLGPGVAAWS